MKDLILHPQTQQAIDIVIQNRPHAIMLTGNEGSGKRHVALSIATEILGVEAQNHPYFLHLEPAGKNMTIDQIRDLQNHMRLKTTGKSDIRRVVLLQDVHTMTVEAQNALLKLLEEPPEDTVLILTAQGDKSLKPTIYSRVQRVQVKPLTKKQALSVTNDEKLYELSGGDMGLLKALASNSKDHELVGAINEAKSLLGASAYQRMLRVEEFSKDKEHLKTLLSALKRVSSAALKAATKKGDDKAAERWSGILQRVYDSEAQSMTNVNSKLLLTELFLSI